MDTQDLFKKYCNFGWALWPATKTLSRYVEAVHRLYKLIAVVCCQIYGPRNTQGGAGCLGMALVWIICGLGRAEFQQEKLDGATRSCHSSTNSELLPVLGPQAPVKVTDHCEACYHICQAADLPDLSKRYCSSRWHQWFSFKCLPQNVQAV